MKLKGENRKAVEKFGSNLGITCLRRKKGYWHKLQVTWKLAAESIATFYNKITHSISFFLF